MKDLPPLINVHLKTNGVNAIAGTSMGAQGAMMLAHRYPDMYRGVCVQWLLFDDGRMGRTSVQSTITSRGGDPANMWGNWEDPNGKPAIRC